MSSGTGAIDPGSTSATDSGNTSGTSGTQAGKTYEVHVAGVPGPFSYAVQVVQCP